MLDRFESFVMGVTVCYKCIQRIKSAEMTEFGLKGTHAMCLFFLHHHEEGLTAASLCQIAAEDKAAVSRTLATLREKGYVVSQGSAYRARWHLTDSGREIATQVDALIEQWVGSGGDGLSDEERAVFYHALDHIAKNLRETVDGASPTAE
ncbi:MAG: winged helix-turn-helix transcriptional regulator [Clostridia bacterium]|nr:winged helix-turn-helix transcriptional regulator [Clostridia bacterium]